MQKTQANSKRFSIQKILLLLLSLSITGCASGPVPKWQGSLWAGDSEHAAIIRAQQDQYILTNAPVFDNYIAMTYADFRSFYSTYILGCRQWKPGVSMMSPDEALERFSIAMKDLQNESMKKIQEQAKK